MVRALPAQGFPVGDGDRMHHHGYSEAGVQPLDGLSQVQLALASEQQPLCVRILIHRHGGILLHQPRQRSGQLHVIRPLLPR